MTNNEARALLEKNGPCPDEAQGNVIKTVILRVLRDPDGPMSCQEIVMNTGLNFSSVQASVRRMLLEGLIKRVVRGLYTAR